jgi:hypothetical protein
VTLQPSLTASVSGTVAVVFFPADKMCPPTTTPMRQVVMNEENVADVHAEVDGPGASDDVLVVLLPPAVPSRELHDLELTQPDCTSQLTRPLKVASSR